MKKLAWILISLILVGCSANTPVPAATATNAPTQTLVPTETPIPPTATLTLTPSTTWTRVPTLDMDQAYNALQNIFEGDEECQLPCWAGITPGVTGWDDAVQMLSPILKLHFSDDLMTFRFGECNYLSWQYVGNGETYNGNLYGSDNNVVQVISLNGDVPIEYSLHNIFAKFGVPKELFIYVNPT